MHKSSFNSMAELALQYQGEIPAGARVLDVGGRNENGSYSDIFDGYQYQTLDIEPPADIIVRPGEPWGFGTNARFDVVISGQCLEHDPRFWVTLAEMGKVTKSNGFVFIIVPSAGPIHRYPVDCYRFLPDVGPVWAEIMGCRLLSVKRSDDNESPRWNDLVLAFRKLAP